MLHDIALYGGLFWNAFLAATLLPALSEVTLAALITEGLGNPLFLFLAATTGNVLGSLLNWWLGARLSTFQDRKWFPFKPGQIERGSRQFAKYGKWSLLLAWVPIIGDPLTLVAGVLKTPLTTFTILASVGKAVRYGIIVIAIL